MHKLTNNSKTSSTCLMLFAFSDEKSELGYEELMNEAIMLRTIQEKVCPLSPSTS